VNYKARNCCNQLSPDSLVGFLEDKWHMHRGHLFVQAYFLI
jgi:hypothetical protein